MNAKLLAGGFSERPLRRWRPLLRRGVRDVASYLPFVAVDGLVVLHDICQRPGQPEVAVHKYWQGVAPRQSVRPASAVSGWGVR